MAHDLIHHMMIILAVLVAVNQEHKLWGKITMRSILQIKKKKSITLSLISESEL